MRKKVYLDRIKRITKTIGEEIVALSKELDIADVPEASDLRDAYSRFSEIANNVAPDVYIRNKDMVGGLYDLIAETREYCTEERAKLKKKLGRA